MSYRALRQLLPLMSAGFLLYACGNGDIATPGSDTESPTSSDGEQARTSPDGTPDAADPPTNDPDCTTAITKKLIREEVGEARDLHMSADGSRLVYTRWDTDPFLEQRSFYADIDTGEIHKIPVGAGFSHSPVLSADGRYIAISTNANGLVPDYDYPAGIHVMRYDTRTDSFWYSGYGKWGWIHMSPDAQAIAFTSRHFNAMPGDDESAQRMLYRSDLTNATVERVSPEIDANEPAISNAGRWIAYRSPSDVLQEGLMADPATLRRNAQTYLYDSQNGTTTRLSKSEFSVSEVSISSDGQWIAWRRNHPASEGRLYDRATGQTTTIFGPNDSPTTGGFRLSANGRFVALTVAGDNDTDPNRGIWVYDRHTGAYTRFNDSLVRVDPSLSVSNDGRRLAYVVEVALDHKVTRMPEVATATVTCR